MSLRQAAQRALEFLSHDMVAEDWPHQKRKDAVCDALRAALAEPEQEPVGWQWLNTCNYRKKLPANAIPEHWRPLFTAPTPRKPLTDEEIDRVTDQQWAQNNHKPIYAAHRAYARAIESAHGIGGGE